MATQLKPINSRRKVEAAQEALRALAWELGANNKMPTVREICRKMKISAVTAGNVLEGLEQQQVVVRRHGSGIYVSPRLYEKHVGLVFGRNAFEPGSSPFCAILVEACQRRARSHNERFSFYLDVKGVNGDKPVHDDLIDAIQKGKLDGALLVARHSEEQEAWLRAQSAPQPPSTVGFDLQALANQAACALAAQRCRHIAMISPNPYSARTFDPALHSAGLFYESSRLRSLPEFAPHNASRREIGAAMMRDILATDTEVDGVIVMDDMLASGVVGAAAEAGRSVGRDLLVASHANRGSTVLQSMEDRLILLEVDPDEIVDAMFAMLETMMARKKADPVAVVVASRTKVGSKVTPLA